MFFDFNLHIDVISYKNNESILFPQNSCGKNKFKNIWLFLHGDGEKQLIEMLLKTRIIISCCFISLLSFFEEDCYASRPGSKECVKVSSASFTVRGRVIDTYGEPLIGATIREKGGANGTVTDVEGISFYPFRIVLFCKFLS